MDRLDRLWPVHNDSFLQLIVELRDLFDGDLDAMLVISALANGTTRMKWRDALVERWDEKGDSRPTNAMSIAHATGIPRETVRRKLRTLESKGWVERDRHGKWDLTGQVADDLRPGTLAAIRYLRRIFSAGLEGGEGP